MIERLILAAVILVMGIVVLKLHQVWLKRRIRQQIALAPQPVIDMPGIPQIMYFTTPDCVVCRIQQQPALERLKAEMGDCVEIIRVDATEEPELARRWGVMTAPMTFILSQPGQASAVNYGFADERKLRTQLEAAAVHNRHAEAGASRYPAHSL